MSFAAAAEQMIVNAGSQFDPSVVDVMLPMLAATEGVTAPGDPADPDALRAIATELSVAAAQLVLPVA
jgi:hypothetical protein